MVYFSCKNAFHILKQKYFQTLFMHILINWCMSCLQFACEVKYFSWRVLARLTQCASTPSEMLLTDILWRSVGDQSQRENLGIIVQYKVKVKLCLGALGG